MDIAIVAEEYNWDHEVSSLTIPITVPAGSDRLLFLTVRCNTDANYPTGVTFDGTAMTQGWAYNETAGQATCWYLVAPAVKTGDIVITWAGSKDLILAYAESLTGVDQSSPLGTPATSGNDDTDTQTVEIPSAVNDLCFGVLIGTTGPWTPDVDQTEINDDDQWINTTHNFCYKAGEASSTDMTWDKDSGSGWAMAIGVAIKPVSEEPPAAPALGSFFGLGF